MAPSTEAILLVLLLKSGKVLPKEGNNLLQCLVPMADHLPVRALHERPYRIYRKSVPASRLVRNS